MPRRRYGKPLDVMQLRAIMSQAIRDTKALTDGPNPPESLVLKVANSLAQLCGPYAKLLEVTDVEKRLTAIEARLGESHGEVH
jgi:hypothetical protein